MLLIKMFCKRKLQKISFKSYFQSLLHIDFFIFFIKKFIKLQFCIKYTNIKNINDYVQLSEKILHLINAQNKYIIIT